MALSMLRQGLQASRGLIPAGRLVPTALSVTKGRTLVSKEFKRDNPDRPKPWPYETVKFTLWDSLYEDTQDRFDENTRLIVIDGNIGVGKSTLAKQLAERFDMCLFPEATMDFKWIDDEGFDIRTLNHLLPESVQPYDIEKFYKTPKHLLTANFQYSMLALRFEQYVDALAHLLSTGQGVILERSFYTDFVFAEAMYKAGYIDDYDKEIYDKMRRQCLFDVLLPHIVIYLDAPIDVLQERIRNRGLPHELETKVLTREYLVEIDRCYKERYLPSIEEKVEVVRYDWSTFGDPNHVVEDLEKLPIDAMMEDKTSKKFEEWKGNNPRTWDTYRMLFTNEKPYLMRESIYGVGRYNHPNLILDPEDIEKWNQVYTRVYPNQYDKGFNRKTNEHMFRIDGDYRGHQREEFFRTR